MFTYSIAIITEKYQNLFAETAGNRSIPGC